MPRVHEGIRQLSIGAVFAGPEDQVDSGGETRGAAPPPHGDDRGISRVLEEGILEFSEPCIGFACCVVVAHAVAAAAAAAVQRAKVPASRRGGGR